MPAGEVLAAKKAYKKGYKKLFKKKWTVADLAKKAFDGVMYMKNLINSEQKQFTQQNAAVSQTYNGNVIQLTNITQGDTTSSREGRSIFINYIQLRGVFTKGSGNDVLRYMVIRDKMGTGTAPAVDQVLQTIGTSLAPFAPLDTSFAGRFQILDTGMVTFSADHPTFVYKKFIRLNKHCKWQTTADGGGTLDGHIYWVSLSNAASSSCSVEFVSRIGFRDN